MKKDISLISQKVTRDALISIITDMIITANC